MTSEPTRGGGRFWTVPLLASALGVSPLTVRRWCASGRIQSLRTPGGHYRIPDAVVQALIAFRPTG